MDLKQSIFSPHLWADISWQLKFQALSADLTEKKTNSLYIQRANLYFTETDAVKTISIALEMRVQTPPHPTDLPGNYEWGPINIWSEVIFLWKKKIKLLLPKQSHTILWEKDFIFFPVLPLLDRRSSL